MRKLLSEVVARVEPGAQRPGRSGRRLPKGEPGIPGRLEPVVRNRQNGVDNVGLITIENLNDMPVGLRIGKFEDIGSRLQDGVRDLNWLVDRENGLLVPFVRLGAMDCQSTC